MNICRQDTRLEAVLWNHLTGIRTVPMTTFLTILKKPFNFNEQGEIQKDYTQMNLQTFSNDVNDLKR